MTQVLPETLFYEVCLTHHFNLSNHLDKIIQCNTASEAAFQWRENIPEISTQFTLDGRITETFFSEDKLHNKENHLAPLSFYSIMSHMKPKQ